mmetsp:Transcript_13878/g.35306  ORF Transcript_13878/g.35306 Transcript_13878/m.35306 type:complete len:222 (+) Transcript_13878:3838-4503(+)
MGQQNTTGRHDFKLLCRSLAARLSRDAQCVAHRNFRSVVQYQLLAHLHPKGDRTKLQGACRLECESRTDDAPLHRDRQRLRLPVEQKVKFLVEVAESHRSELECDQRCGPHRHIRLTRREFKVFGEGGGHCEGKGNVAHILQLQFVTVHRVHEYVANFQNIEQKLALGAQPVACQLERCARLAARHLQKSNRATHPRDARREGDSDLRVATGVDQPLARLE